MRSLWLVLILVPIAGCLEAGESADVQSTELPYGALPLTAQALTAESRVDGADDALETPGADDWFVLPNDGTDACTSTAYVLPVLEGSEVPHWFDEDRTEHILEYAWLEDPLLTAYAMVAIDMDSGEVLANTMSASAEPYEAHGSYIYLGTDLEAGDSVGIIVNACSDGDATVGLRFMPENPWDSGYDWPAEDGEEFLDDVEDGQAWLPALQGSGTGFDVDFYMDAAISFGLPYYYQAQGGDMQVDDQSTVLLGARPRTDIRLNAASEQESGFTMASAMYNPDNKVGSATVSLDARGATYGGTTTVTPDDAPLFFGWAFAFAVGDGTGPSTLSMEIETTGGPEAIGFESISAVHFAIHTTVEELLGIAIKDDGYARDSGLLQRDDGTLRLPGPGTGITWVL